MVQFQRKLGIGGKYQQLNDLCVVTSVKVCLIYEDNIFINSYLIERKTPGLIMKVMDEL